MGSPRRGRHRCPGRTSETSQGGWLLRDGSEMGGLSPPSPVPLPKGLLSPLPHREGELLYGSQQSQAERELGFCRGLLAKWPGGGQGLGMNRNGGGGDPEFWWFGQELQGQGGEDRPPASVLGFLQGVRKRKGGTCADPEHGSVAVKRGDRRPLAAPRPPHALVSKRRREATRLYKCNINRPFPTLTRWEPALPKDLNSICFIEVSFFSPNQCIKLSFY